MYPEPLYDGPIRVLLFTVVPAGLFAFVPARLALAPDPAWLAGYLALATLLMAGAWRVFHRGLEHYESGSQVVLSA